MSSNVELHEPDDERARLYVAGRLSPTDAEAFEEHYFSCEACWREVESAQELRQALAPSASIRSGIPAWKSFAAAAIVALGFLGIWQLTRRDTVDEIRWRGRDANLPTSSSRTDAGTVIRWDSVVDATRYSVRLLGPDGQSLDQHTTHSSPITLSADQTAKASHYRVLAIDQFGASLADSGVRPLR